jgi:hypothetical protein
MDLEEVYQVRYGVHTRSDERAVTCGRTASGGTACARCGLHSLLHGRSVAWALTGTVLGPGSTVLPARDTGHVGSCGIEPYYAVRAQATRVKADECPIGSVRVALM